MSTFAYIKNFIKDRNVASITPSSPFVVKRISRKINFSKRTVVVEYGPGTGVFSKHFLARMTLDSRLILIEQNPAFVRTLRRELGHDARVELCNDSAENVLDIMEAAGEPKADYVVSGIPFSFLSDECRRELLHHTYQVLSDHGKFLVYQHYNHMQKALQQHFDRVKTERELLNIPPLCIWEAVKTNGTA